MMTVKIKTGRWSKKTIAKIPNLDSAMVKRGVRNGWLEVGRDWEKTTSDEIKRRPKSGRTYIIRHRATGKRRRHIASAPGETHANITGLTRRSLSYKVPSFAEMTVGYQVSGDAKNPASFWGKFLEFGTKKKRGRMKPRPSIQIGIAAITRNAEVYMAREIQRP